MILAIDIDHTVSLGRFWKDGEAQPIKPMREKVNRLYKAGHTIIMHTARHPEHYALTYAWLVQHGFYFHALEMGKLSADHYVDDKAMTLDQFKAYTTELA